MAIRDTAAPRLSWDPAYAAVAVTILGGVVYAVFRIAYTLFYSRLGTTPEDVGLGYAQTLVRGVLPAIVLAFMFLVVVTYAAYIVRRIIRQITRSFRLYRLLILNPRSILTEAQKALDGSTPPSEVDPTVRAVMKSLVELVPPDELAPLLEALRLLMDEPIRSRRKLLAVTSRTALASIPTVIAAGSAAANRALIPRLMPDMKFIFRTAKHRVTVISVLTLSSLALFALAWYAGERVSDGHPLNKTVSSLIGVVATPSTVKPVDIAKPLPREVGNSRSLLYLGAVAGTTVLYDYNTKATTRVPSASVVISLE